MAGGSGRMRCSFGAKRGHIGNFRHVNCENAAVSWPLWLVRVYRKSTYQKAKPCIKWDICFACALKALVSIGSRLVVLVRVGAVHAARNLFCLRAGLLS